MHDLRHVHRTAGQLNEGDLHDHPRNPNGGKKCGVRKCGVRKTWVDHRAGLPSAERSPSGDHHDSRLCPALDPCPAGHGHPPVWERMSVRSMSEGPMLLGPSCAVARHDDRLDGLNHQSVALKIAADQSSACHDPMRLPLANLRPACWKLVAPLPAVDLNQIVHRSCPRAAVIGLHLDHCGHDHCAQP